MAWPDASVIRVVTVAEPGAESFLAMPGVMVSAETIDRIMDGTRAQSEELLSTSAGQLTRPDRVVDTAFLEGRVASAIAAAGRDFHADVIVVGHHGRGALGSMLLGSVSAELVEYTTTPVLVAHGESLRRLILADDGSASAAAARALVARMPGFKGLAVRVVSVSDRPPGWVGWLEPEAPDDIEALETAIESEHERHDALAVASAAELSAAGLVADSASPVGDPGTEIVRAAQAFGADVIVMGTRGQTGLERLLVGSVARKVLNHAHCSILVLPSR